MLSLRPRCLPLLIATLCAPAFAQEAPPEPVQRVEVKGTAAGYDPRRDDTASRIVVKREDILRYGDTSLLDVFKRIPGVTVTSGAGRSQEVRMRGLGAGYTQILVNGERMPAGFALDSLSPQQIERIEVLRVATAEMSAQSVAGTINIVLRSSGSKAARKREREAKLGYLYGELARGPTASVQLGDRAEGSSWSVSASASEERFERTASGFEENLRPDGVVDLLRTTRIAEQGRDRRINLSPRLGWTLANGDTLAWENMFSAFRFRNHAHLQVSTALGAPPPVPDLRTVASVDNAMVKSDLRWTRSLASGANLDAKLGVDGNRFDDLYPRVGLDSAGRPATDGSVRARVRGKGASSTGKYTRKFDAGHVLALGWEAGVNANDELRAERDAVRVFPAGQVLDETFEATIARTAVYAQDEWAVTPQWSVYLGARWEGIRTRVRGNAVEDTRVESSVLSPVFQTLYKLPGEKGDQLRLAVSRTYKAPALTTLVPRRRAWENNSPTEADYQGNPALEPELAWGVDAGWEHYWAEGAMVSVGGSLRRIDNYTGGRVYFDGLRWIYMPANEDRALLRSLELEAKFPLKSLFAGAPAIDLRASLSRNWSRVASVPGPDNRMERQTPLSANLGIDYKAGALAAGASLAHRSGGFVRVAADRSYYSHARTDIETYAVWKFTPSVQLRMAASNLLGEDNEWEIGYTDPVTGREKRGWNFPDGAKLRTTLEMKF